MTPEEFKNLAVGDVVRYCYTGTSFCGAVCEVVESTIKGPRLKIVKVGENGRFLWGNSKSVSSQWDYASAFKFELITPLDKTARIIKKIKDLDTRWAISQAKKGNKYALLLL